MKKRAFATVLAAVMAATALAGCGGSKTQAPAAAPAETKAEAAAPAETQAEAAAPAAQGGIFKGIEGYAYASLDPHKDYYAWHSQRYGLTETLYRVNDDMSISPWLAKDCVQDGNKVTITLQDGACFSNGNPLTSEMIYRNIERLAGMNQRFEMYMDWEYEFPDDQTLVITTGADPYPTILNDLAEPGLCFMDLDNTTDFDLAPISTGPFAVTSFQPEGDLEMVKNENYWGGEVNCDGAIFYAMSDPNSKLMALQNGEVDAYEGLSASDVEIYSLEPDAYRVELTATPRLINLFVNDKIPENIRKAIILALDRDAIAAYFPGMMEGSQNVFADTAAYGKEQQEPANMEAATAAMEAEGYTLENGKWTKDGQTLSYKIGCYSSRSIDQISVLMCEQLAAFGIDVEIDLKEDCDSTYMTSHDFDLAMYCAIVDPNGDPKKFMQNFVQKGSWGDVAGFGNDETDKKVTDFILAYDFDKRYEIANEIMREFYDSWTYTGIVKNNRSFVCRTGVANCGETNPFDYYGINKDTFVPAE